MGDQPRSVSKAIANSSRPLPLAEKSERGSRSDGDITVDNQGSSGEVDITCAWLRGGRWRREEAIRRTDDEGNQGMYGYRTTIERIRTPTVLFLQTFR